MSTTNISSLSKLQALLPELFETPQIQGETYLHCHLNHEISGLVSMDFVQESLLIPWEKITFLPNIPSFVMGLMTSRDRVFFVIDLPNLLGLSSPFSLLQTYQIIVLSISSLVPQSTNTDKEYFVGLAVPKIQGIMRVRSEEREPAQKSLPEEFFPFVQETIKEEKNLLYVLNLTSIVEQIQGI
ncbi:chemotaxis protein CheW [Crocosphaera sp. Alani8]|uniref:chemotaxis protein CheW n=1 Tax=Crocosphaera sp. Alani8 TaxID=3038952 RepID=UPI00313C14CB